ncbi:hypothetical protein ACIQMJ_37150 [Actinosynnema sp. NPDC091369]
MTLFDRLKRFGVAFTLMGMLAVPAETDYWSIDAVDGISVVEAA